MERLTENGVHSNDQPEISADEKPSVKNPSHLVNGESELSTDESVGADGGVSKDNGSSTSLPVEHRSGTNGQFPSVYGSQMAMNEAATRQGYRSTSEAEKILYGNLHNSGPDGAGNGRRRMTSKTNVYVSGLKPTDTQESLASLVHPKLTPKSVTVVADKDGRSQGYGFLDFKSEDESRAAIELIKESNPKFVVRLANESEKDKTNLYLRGLPRNDTYDEEDLSAAFRSFGEVVSVKIMTERNPSPGNQHPRTGIGFVRFQNEEDARRALERINDAKEQIVIKGMDVTVEAKFADKQVGRSHTNHNAHPPSGTSAGGNHHSMSAATRPMANTVSVHGNSLSWNLLPNGAPLYQQHGLAATGLFRNNYPTVAPAPNGPIVWAANNAPTYLPENWSEANLSTGMASMSISSMNHMSNEPLSETAHLPVTGGQPTHGQQTQTNSEPNTTISHANAMQGTNSGVVLSRHPSVPHQNHQAVDWSILNSHVHQADHNSGRTRHSNTTQTQTQPSGQAQGQHMQIQPHQLGPNANGFTPFFNMNQTTNAIGYNANQANGYMSMVAAPPVTIHSTEGGYQLTPGGCVFYGSPPIYSSTHMAPNASGHVNPFHGASAGSVASGPSGNIPNGSVGIYPYHQNGAFQWAALAANNGANMSGLAAPHYYQAPHANGYPAMCTFPQPPAQGSGRLQHGNNVPNAQATAPQAPAPSSVSVTGNGCVTTAATAP